VEKAEHENRVYAAHALNVEFHQIDRLIYFDHDDFIVAVVAGRHHQLSRKRIQASKRAVENILKRQGDLNEAMRRHREKQYEQAFRNTYSKYPRGNRPEGKPFTILTDGTIVLDATEYRHVA
jgi:hypothetical protein